MSFARWLKFKVVRGTLFLVAILSLVGAGYSFFSFTELLRMVGVASGVVIAIISLVGARYYRVKMENLFFLDERRGKTPREEKAV